MDEKTVSEIIAESTDELKEIVRKQVVAAVGESISWKVRDAVAAEVNKHATEIIAPMVVKELAAAEGAILEAVQEAAAGIGEALKTQMLENAVKALTSYNGADILQKLMGGR